MMALPLPRGAALESRTPGVNMSYPAGMKWQDPMRVAQTTMMPEPITYYNHLARLDHVLTARHRMFGRDAERRALFGPYRHRFGNIASGNHFLGDPINVVLDDVWLVNPLTVVNFRYGLQRFPGSHYLLSQGFDLTTLGLPKSLVDQLGFRHPMGVVFPRVEVAGARRYGKGRTVVPDERGSLREARACWVPSDC